MPNSEMIRGDITRALGGHSDLFVSHRVFWSQGRKPGQPLVENDATYGKVYHVGSTADMMEMAHRENMLLFMPHPRTKGSAGFPDAIKAEPHFIDPNYRGVGFRWGMGLDGSETRLCEYRCLPLFDDMNNWVADLPTPPKYLQAISEVYQQGYGDDIYANNPVNYVRLTALPAPGDWTPIVDAMKNGDYFVTSGEVLIPELRRTRIGQRAHDRRRCRMDVPAGLRGSRVGRRQEDGSPDHPDDRFAGVGHPPLRDSVRRGRQEVGALRGVGLGRQRRVRDACKARAGRSLNCQV